MSEDVAGPVISQFLAGSVRAGICTFYHPRFQEHSRRVKRLVSVLFKSRGGDSELLM
jgi:hypothetical protein